jgi:hypothetical protein
MSFTFEFPISLSCYLVELIDLKDLAFSLMSIGSSGSDGRMEIALCKPG